MKTVTRQLKNNIVIHFAGDSGDGMQLTGMQFTQLSAAMGNDTQTLPDFPAEIRAPAGTLAGVSGFQLSFADYNIYTPGDQFDVLVAMNPAALKATFNRLKPGGILIVDEDQFQTNALRKVGYTDNPLFLEEMSAYRVIIMPITQLTLKTTAAFQLTRPKSIKCKNMFVLGTLCWLYDRPVNAAHNWLSERYRKESVVATANQVVLKAGYDYAITTEIFNEFYHVPPAKFPVGKYKQITGNLALSMGCAAASVCAKTPMLVAGYPITPASDILHNLAQFNLPGIKIFQAEDEMGAIGAAIGAAFGGSLALTSTSGPGMDLKAESLGLAVMTELPLVVIDVQRSGPSTGMPTKVEQSDLLMALYGRHGECPLPVIAPGSPADCFTMIIEAFRIAVTYMTPVIVLCDAYLANTAEPWLIPDVSTLPDIVPKYRVDPKDYQAYARDKQTLARDWVKPGTPDLMHRIGGLEKSDISGHISYDPDNHQKMVSIRQQKVDNIKDSFPPLEVMGQSSGQCLIISWGSTQGVVKTVVENMQANGFDIAMLHLRYLNPLPKDLAEIILQFKTILVVELNSGQLLKVIRSEYLVDAQGVNKVTGQPFFIYELEAAFLEFFKNSISVNKRLSQKNIETVVLTKGKSRSTKLKRGEA
jgi:2-oxoglutarate/2-oxoacid ferredoxin oxidoreductase subunit alpha